MKVIISACLFGVHCRYDGKSATNHSLLKKLDEAIVIPICPEQLGGLPTPREKSLITEGTAMDVLAGKGKVLTESGKNVTANFIRGAKESYRIARFSGAKIAYLKDKSPSCAMNHVYSKEGKITKGRGITAQFLSLHGIQVIAV